MKKIIFVATILFSILFFTKADAQISISINIGSQPIWGPTGYDHVDYYYFPDIGCYYYVPQRMFIYPRGSQWIYASSLPPQYSTYNLYTGYKVVLNGVHKPYLQNSIYRSRYSSYRGRRGQAVIRDSHDPKYSRPPARPQPKPQPSRPGNGGHPQPKPQPSKPGNGGHPQPKPQPSKPGNGGHPQPKPQPSKPGNGGHPQPKPQPSKPGNGGHPQPKPQPSKPGNGGHPQPKSQPKPSGQSGSSKKDNRQQ